MSNEGPSSENQPSVMFSIKSNVGRRIKAIVSVAIYGEHLTITSKVRRMTGDAMAARHKFYSCTFMFNGLRRPLALASVAGTLQQRLGLDSD
jgi:hypothetical protein